MNTDFLYLIVKTIYKEKNPIQDLDGFSSLTISVQKALVFLFIFFPYHIKGKYNIAEKYFNHFVGLSRKLVKNEKWKDFEILMQISLVFLFKFGDTDLQVKLVNTIKGHYTSSLKSILLGKIIYRLVKDGEIDYAIDLSNRISRREVIIEVYALFFLFYLSEENDNKTKFYLNKYLALDEKIKSRWLEERFYSYVTISIEILLDKCPDFFIKFVKKHFKSPTQQMIMYYTLSKYFKLKDDNENELYYLQESRKLISKLPKKYIKVEHSRMEVESIFQTEIDFVNGGPFIVNLSSDLYTLKEDIYII